MRIKYKYCWWTTASEYIKHEDFIDNNYRKYFIINRCINLFGTKDSKYVPYGKIVYLICG